MSLRALAAQVALLDVLLGVVPGGAPTRHLKGEKKPSHYRPDEHAAERLGAEDVADRKRRHHRDDTRKDHLPLRGGGDDANRGSVLGLAGAVHDPLDLAELPAHLLHDQAACAADCEHRERAEQERQDAAEKQADDHVRVREVELGRMARLGQLLRV